MKIYVFFAAALCLQTSSFASASSPQEHDILEDAIARYMSLVSLQDHTAHQDTLKELKGTFKFFAQRQDFNDDRHHESTFCLGLMALFGGPGPRDFHKSWTHFETLKGNPQVPPYMQDKAASFMAILITKGHIPAHVTPQECLMDLMATHTLHVRVKERVQTFLGQDILTVPPLISQMPCEEVYSDWEQDPPWMASLSEEEHESHHCPGLVSQTPSPPSPSCARIRPYTRHNHVDTFLKRRRKQ